MSDLIDRQAALDAVNDCGICIQKILDIPSIEPERTAKVLPIDDGRIYKCLNCGQYFHKTSWGAPVKYCSRCGKKLEWE